MTGFILKICLFTFVTGLSLFIISGIVYLISDEFWYGIATAISGITAIVMASLMGLSVITAIIVGIVNLFKTLFL